MANVSLLFREYMYLDRRRGGDGLTPIELKRWGDLKRMLSKRFSPDISDQEADKRTSLRIPTRLTVSFQNLGDFRCSTMTNLSRGGLFIVTEHPVEIGTKFTLLIHIHDPPEKLEVPVVAVTQNVGPRSPVGFRGTGVAFREMDSALRERLDQIYQQKLEEVARTSD